jgi:hypothetical protein
MVLVDRDSWEAERVQGGYCSAWQRNRDGKVRAVDLYSKQRERAHQGRNDAPALFCCLARRLSSV